MQYYTELATVNVYQRDNLHINIISVLAENIILISFCICSLTLFSHRTNKRITVFSCLTNFAILLLFLQLKLSESSKSSFLNRRRILRERTVLHIPMDFNLLLPSAILQLVPTK